MFKKNFFIIIIVYSLFLIQARAQSLNPQELLNQPLCAIGTYTSVNDSEIRALVPRGEPTPQGWKNDRIGSEGRPFVNVDFLTFANKPSSAFIPLYIVWRADNRGFFYTININEVKKIQSEGWRLVGHIGYVLDPNYPGAERNLGLQPLYRYYDKRKEYHRYATLLFPKEPPWDRYLNEGLIGFVPRYTQRDERARVEQDALKCKFETLKSDFYAAIDLIKPFSISINLKDPISLTGALNSLNNTSAFTMPMGNNFTMPMGNNLVSSINGTSVVGLAVTSIDKPPINLANAEPLANASLLNNTSALGSISQLNNTSAFANTGGRGVQGLGVNPGGKDVIGVVYILQPGGGQKQAQQPMCMAGGGPVPKLVPCVPENNLNSIWVYKSNDNKIYWINPKTATTESCLSVGAFPSNPELQMPTLENCQSAATWQYLSNDPDAIQLQRTKFPIKSGANVLQVVLDPTPGTPSFIFARPRQDKKMNTGLGIHPVPLTKIQIPRQDFNLATK